MKLKVEQGKWWMDSFYEINNYMGNKIDMIGKTFGKLLVLEEVKERSKNNKILYKCKCTCGNEKIINGENVRTGHTSSCGCSRTGINVKHNMSYTVEHKTWGSMKRRCHNKNDSRYKDWGGRGIKVCDRWFNSFENFFEDMGYRPSKHHSIERINNDGDYEPSNCIWADKKTQDRNRRNSMRILHENKIIDVFLFSEKLNISVVATRARIRRNYKLTDGVYVKYK